MPTPSFYDKQFQINLTNESIVVSENLHQMAFDNSLQATILTTTAGNGKIIEVNGAACKLLGYSKEELLTQSRDTIFDINRTSFKKMLTQRISEGHSSAVLTAIKKSGELFSCEVTSVVFMGEHNVEKAITTIVDISERILRQKNIDIKNEKIVADNIVIAITKQKNIDIIKEKIVAENIAVANSNHKYLNNIRQKMAANNIVLAQSKQKIIDILNEEIVAENIVIANTRQKEIDIKKEKVVADNIILAELKQKEIDIIKEQIVADNIFIANTKQKEIDITKERVAADNIVLAESKQKNIDIIKEQIVADNIILAESKQKEIDIVKEQIVADNIVIANIKQKEIDITKERVVADNIVLAESKQKEIDITRERVVADNIVLAESKQKNIDIIKEQIVADNIVIANTKQKDIDILKDQIVADNIILAQAKSDARQVENNEWVKNLRERREIEKSDIVTELHENINQLLCASRMYLTMAKGDVKNSEMFLTSASQCTLTAIEAIGKLTKGLTTESIKNFGLRKSIENVSREIMEANTVKISCAFESFTEPDVNDKFKMNVLRIVQEQLKNILNHANATEVVISISQNNDSITLYISDNGVGFDTYKKRQGIGVDNIKSRAASYNGTADFVSQPGTGCTLTITLPVKDAA